MKSSKLKAKNKISSKIKAESLSNSEMRIAECGINKLKAERIVIGYSRIRIKE